MSRLPSSSGAMRGRGVTAVLGPTNTGKTHLAIERLLAHDVGIIGLPLRLLAREVYDKIVARIGPAKVALITGEEKIKPPSPRHYVCTVEAMPLDLEADFVAVDEIQLAADGERGHVFTDRLFHARGSARRCCSAPPPCATPSANCCLPPTSSRGRAFPRSLT